ncbi:MAG: intradiol ring-cleavage dioxygenase [Gammaproteobacteria bacterium]|jgi:protocatechuate 3,4-dioxygenase beta subunit|nr:intradiol ring-cleavage dioxygenase [Gammaproteobacteria bacterium]
MHGHVQTTQRRRLLLAALGLVSSCLATAGGAATRRPTPAQSRGPFYPDQLPLDQDNDLTRLSPARAATSASAKGVLTDLTGRVLAADGTALPDALVEIWQCDAHGRYLHTRDRGGRPRDPGFQGYGKARTAADGGYRFRTIKPVPYPGRAPHIHVAVTAADGRQLVTQLYVEGAPENARDFLRKRLSPAQRKLVTVPFRPSGDDAGSLRARFDMVLG